MRAERGRFGLLVYPAWYIFISTCQTCTLYLSVVECGDRLIINVRVRMLNSKRSLYFGTESKFSLDFGLFIRQGNNEIIVAIP